MSEYHSTEKEYGKEKAMISNKIELLEKWISRLKSSDNLMRQYDYFKAIQRIAEKGARLASKGESKQKLLG